MCFLQNLGWIPCYCFYIPIYDVYIYISFVQYFPKKYILYTLNEYALMANPNNSNKRSAKDKGRLIYNEA